jgi:flavin-dependent dehydrogenase
LKNGRLNIGVGATAVLFKETGALNAYHHFVKELRTKGFLPHRLELAKERSFPLPFKKTADYTVNGKVLLVGDAAGFVSPVSGEGIYYGIKGGKLAAEAIGRNLEHGIPLISYQKSWQRAFGRDLNKYGYPLREVVYKNKKRMELVVALGRHDEKMALLFTKMLYGEYSYGQTIRKALLRLPISILKIVT